MNELKFIKVEILTMMRFQYDVAETIEGKDSVSARARQQNEVAGFHCEENMTPCLFRTAGEAQPLRPESIVLLPSAE